MNTVSERPNVQRVDTVSVLKGFEHVKRYWDNRNQTMAAKILPGEFYVTRGDELVVTVLGSCISACIRDPQARVGGMNHFMLPDAGDRQFAKNAGGCVSESDRYGNYAMEHLINEILKNGGRRNNLEVKIFGGGKILANMTDIGERNIRFIRKYIFAEQLNLVAEDVADIYPRKVIYHPLSGRVRVKKLRAMHNRTIIEREQSYRRTLHEAPLEGEVELF